MGAAAPIIAIVGTVVSTAYAAYAQKAAGDFQAAIARRNAENQEAMARDAAARGLNEGVRVALIGGHVRGEARAAYGASGISLASGSPLDVLGDIAMFNELDKQTARSNANREAFTYRAQAGNFTAQAKADTATGTNQAIGTLLTGAGTVAGDYYRLNR